MSARANALRCIVWANQIFDVAHLPRRFELHQLTLSAIPYGANPGL
jgi:hypothetical protein